MTIIAARIDGRLIHGQVANLWTTKLNISRIMVVDDEIVDSSLEKTALKVSYTCRSQIIHFNSRESGE